MKRGLSVTKSQIRSCMMARRLNVSRREGIRTLMFRAQAEQALKLGRYISVSVSTTRCQYWSLVMRPGHWPLPEGGRVIAYSISRLSSPCLMVCSHARRVQGSLNEQRVFCPCDLAFLRMKKSRNFDLLTCLMHEEQIFRCSNPRIVNQSW